MDQQTERELELEQEEEKEEEKDPLRCATCGLDLADREAITGIGGRAPVEVFINPHGVMFELLTVSAARHLVHHGPPTTEFTWFVGYAWSIATCAGCASHLGWAFEATSELQPARFVGFIRTRVR